MFFAAIIVVPLVAGVVAGLVTASRRAPLGLAGLCVAVGVAGAIVTAFDPEVEGRVESVTFALAAGVGAAALAYFGWVAGQVASARRS